MNTCSVSILPVAFGKKKKLDKSNVQPKTIFQDLRNLALFELKWKFALVISKMQHFFFFFFLD